jgi:NAD(P) transhydrogenase subunit beta
MGLATLNFIYLLASISFVLGIKMLGSPKTARKGNLIAAFGMILAILATIFVYPSIYNIEVSGLKYMLIFGAIAVGTIIGWSIAMKVAMTKMPELVSFFNGMGGATAGLIGLLEFSHNIGHASKMSMIVAGLVIGSISFSGSMIAWSKLSGK